MRHFLNKKFPGLRDAIQRNRQEKALRHSRVAAVLNTVESVVDGTDSKIRLVPGYKKKLKNVVQSALEFSDDLVDQIPGAIEVSRGHFTSDPYVNAFFTNVTDLQSIVCHSSEIKDFMEDIHDDSAPCCALLCMRRTEKTVLGMELSDNMLKRDVQQIAVSFSDHRIYSPAPSEAETREGLKTCLFQGLVTHALERIMQLRLENHHLQSRYQMLHARLRHYQQKSGEAISGIGMDVRAVHTIEETSQELKQTEQKMMNTPRLTPQIALEQVADVFSKPWDFIQLRKSALRLNKMGIRISDDSPEPANKLNLTEVIIGNDMPRVVTLALFPQQELHCRAAFSIHA
jgi:hypothetical protein